MSSTKAYAKINLALVVGPARADGKHEVVSVLQQVDLCDVLHLEHAPGADTVVEGFEDTIVRRALEAFSQAADGEVGWRVRIEKHIPVAAGLGGGSSNAAAALSLANAAVTRPLTEDGLRALAAEIGADVPFFLTKGTQLATGDGSELSPLALPLDVLVVLVVPNAESKQSTAGVYAAFDARDGAEGFVERRARLLASLEQVRAPVDLARLPANDLASSALAGRLVEVGAFRADVTGAGPTVYGLFERASDAERAARLLEHSGKTWLVRPVVGA